MRMPPCAWSGEQCVHLDSRCCLAVSCVYVMASEGEMAGYWGISAQSFFASIPCVAEACLTRRALCKHMSVVWRVRRQLTRQL
jgi:hypothetical protein